MSDHRIITGSRGEATWDGGQAPGAVNLIDGVHLLALRMPTVLPMGTVVELATQRWRLEKETTSTVRGMRVYRVVKAPTE